MRCVCGRCRQDVPISFHRNAMASSRMNRAPFRHVEQQRLQHGQQHLRILEVQVHLVGAEGGPDLLRPGGGGELRQQRQSTRAHHLGKVRAARHRDEEVAVAGVIREEPLKPLALRGDVVEDRVEHQVEVRAQPRDVVPGAVARLDGEEVLHRESVVRRPRVERQEVDAADHPLQMARTELRQHLQRWLAAFAHLVGVGDEQHVPLADPFRSGFAGGYAGAGNTAVHQVAQPPFDIHRPRTAIE